ncbi:GNAT family N-acetyltransferase [Streptomyces sp. NPDC101118]|uniref:GNAT family N-acetyltransferase n=1 Tax=Streptomyces sp. NPDC101118 TaxID=3366109 RepID=UPI0037FD7D3D
MADDQLLGRARGLWEALADVPVSFTSSGGPAVVVAPDSAFCPPSWCGVVALGDSAVVTAPGAGAARSVSRALAGVTAAELTRPETVRALLPVSELLGPASLAYASGDGFRPAHGHDAVESLAPGHPDLLALVRAVDRADADESGMEEIASPAFVVRDGGDVVAAAGYETWPGGAAHVCVLTAPQARGRRLARTTASAAVAHAFAAGLLPQWRARPPASRRVAHALGFRELGRQLSFRLVSEGSAATR